MDVIALSEAGFGASVAPLGTAVTEDQLRLLWRLSPEPVIALDGDTAGLRAAFRVIDLALPLIEAGHSLRFALMPEGKDPDDLVRAGGTQAVQEVLDASMPMVNLLWRRETEGQVYDSPERKAMLDKVLREKTALIRDPNVRKHYDDAFYQMKRDMFFQRRPQRGAWKPQGQQPIHQETRSSFLAAAAERDQEILHEAVLLAVLIKAPDIVVNFEHDLEETHLELPEHERIKTILLQYAHNGGDVLEQEVARQMGEGALAKLMSAPHVAIVPALRRPDDLDLARLTVDAELQKLKARRGRRMEVEDALEDFSHRPSESLTHRLKDAAEESYRAEANKQEDTTEYDIGPNGAPISREERKRSQELYDNIRFTKSRH